MSRILIGTLMGATPARSARIHQELADAVIGDEAVIRLLVETEPKGKHPARVMITLDRDAPARLIGRYELEPKVWLNIERIAAVARVPKGSWTTYERQAPIPRRRSARTP
jgi:hypothetical protein